MKNSSECLQDETEVAIANWNRNEFHEDDNPRTQDHKLGSVIEPVQLFPVQNNDGYRQFEQALYVPTVRERLNHFWTVTLNQVKGYHTLECDRGDEDVLNVTEYTGPILQNMLDEQRSSMAQSNYMKNQVDINEKMRGILVDWIIEVHLRFKLLPETLFLTINLIDRYLDKTQIMRTRLQLVAVAALWIASKYEEIYLPELKDFVFISDNAYSKDEIRAMERSILMTLEFSI